MAFLKKKLATKTVETSATPNAHPGYAMEYWKLKAMFEDDPDFGIGELNDAERSCTVTIRTNTKAELFNSMIRLNYLNAHVEASDTPISEAALAELFSTNPHFSRLYEAPHEEGEEPLMKAVLFNPECMHYFSDDFFSPTGHTAILPQDLARDLFGGALNIQTDLEKLGTIDF